MKEIDDEDILVITAGHHTKPGESRLDEVQENVAVMDSVASAIEARRDVAYIPWFWRPVMALIRAMPEALFKRLRL